MKTQIRFVVGAVALILIVGTTRPATAPVVHTIGRFRWDGTTGDVLLQRVSPDRLLVQTRIMTSSETSAGSRKWRTLPTGAMEAWVLLEDGTALEQTPRQPPKGAPAVGVENAGTAYSFVTFGYKCRPKDRIAAVVVKIETDLHVFATGGVKD